MRVDEYSKFAERNVDISLKNLISNGLRSLESKIIPVASPLVPASVIYSHECRYLRESLSSIFIQFLYFISLNITVDSRDDL